MVDLTGEIRKLLTGRYHIVDGIIIAFDDNTFKNLLGWQGLPTGGNNAMILGVNAEAFEYEYDSLKISEPLQEIMKILIKYGKLTALAASPNSVGFLVKNINTSYLYVVDETNTNRIRVSVYTSRSTTSSLTFRKAFKDLDDELPEGFSKFVYEEDEGDRKDKKKHKKKSRHDDEEDFTPADDFDF